MPRMTAPAHEPSPTSAPPALLAAAHVPSRPQFRRKRKSLTTRVVAAALVVLAAAGLAATRLWPKPVTATPVVLGTAVSAVYATGSVESLDRVVVKAKTPGTIDLKVREGARVKKGDLLAVIDSPTLRYDLARGQAEAWAAEQQASAGAPQLAALEAQARAIEADLKAARDERDRVQKLVASGSVPQPELDRATARVASLEAQLEANTAQRRSVRIELSARASGSRSQVDSLSARLADAELRAPMDGVVLTRSVEPGETVMLNQPLLKIGDVSNLILECAIDESDVGAVRLGARAAVSIYAFRDQVFRGEVFEIMPDADRARKTFLTKLKLVDAPEGLRSGMTVEVNVISTERPGALLAPAGGVDAHGSTLVVSDGKLSRRTVGLGVRDMARVEITSGLSVGDLVVTGGAEELPDGARVRVTLVPPVEATAKGGAHAGMSL